jgi:hypothetical protein
MVNQRAEDRRQKTDMENRGQNLEDGKVRG